jgi:chromosome segregation ATPase
MTAAKLQIEVEARTADLDKIKNLEVRIDKEMETVAEGINNMEDAMQNKFSKIDDLKAEFEQEKRRLYLIKDLVEKYKAKLGQQTTYHGVKHDTRKNQILQSDVYNRLNDIEKRLIGNESQIYGIQQYIEAKGAESNYQSHFQACMNLCADINEEVKKKAQQV